MSDVTPCRRFEQDGALRMERGEPLDEHFSICPECVASRAKYERVAAVLKHIAQTSTWEKLAPPRANTGADPETPEVAPRVRSKPDRAPAPRLLRAGAMLDEKYRLSYLIKRGRTCAVWAARNTTTYRAVAIKLLLQPTAERTLEFMREVHAHGWLSHRNVIDIVDLGETDQGNPFLVMPLLTGENLAHRSRRGRLYVMEVLRICRDVARALATAHAAGIGHGALKQEGIFLHQEEESECPVVKVLGLSTQGIAQDTEAGCDTPPVELRGNAAQSSDIASLGIILIELLTGTPIPKGASHSYLQSIINRRLQGIVEIDRFLQSDLRALLTRCFRGGGSEDVITAAEIAAALHLHLSASEPPPSCERPEVIRPRQPASVIRLHACDFEGAQVMAPGRVELPAQMEFHASTAKLGTARHWASLLTSVDEPLGNSTNGERHTGS